MEQARRQRAEFLYQHLCRAIAYIRNRLEDITELIHNSTKVDSIDTSALTGWENRQALMQRLKRNYETER
ncbi:hypothetical protein HYU13_04290 [Candidatus Woesearchaeota archaeon]|nr:hypothetical protein [Candidatus Woesearchaeota archaeon]